MSEYLLSIVGVVFLSAVVCAIIPEGKKTSEIAKSALKLLCLLVILTPFGKMLQKDGAGVEKFFSQSGIKIDESFIEYCSEKAILTAQEQIQKEIYQQFGEKVNVSLAWAYDDLMDVNKIKIKMITVFAEEENIENQESIQAYLYEKYGCEVKMQTWT